MAELAARQVVVERGGSRLLDRVDLVVEPGELVAVMGAAGAGKSTLARVLAGLIEPDVGAVDGAAVGRVGLVMQRPEATFLTERVVDEVSIAARWNGMEERDAAAAAGALLDTLALGAQAGELDPLALSGGEQRRVAIAAVLAARPAVVILDEPGAGLDAHARAAMHAALGALHARGQTIILISHDPAEVAELASRLVVLDAGRVAWDGSIDEVLGDPARAAALGLEVAPEVQVLHEVAASRGVELVSPVPAGPAAAMTLLTQLVGSLPTPAGVDARDVARDVPSEDPAAVQALPPRIDARVRVLACVLGMAAALVASSLLASTLVVAGVSLVLGVARVERARIRLAVRPLLMLAVMLVVLQLLLGGEATTALAPGITSSRPELAALLRSLQAAGVILATLALSATTSTVDLAAAVRSLLGPLRLLRLPIAALSFVTALGLGLVPVLSDELERLREAQRARGMHARGRGPLGRLRLDAMLLGPLVVAAFRRAHLLADALVVRGFDPRTPMASWRPRIVPRADVAALALGAVLLGVARFT